MSRKLWFLNTAVNETENDKAEYAARESNVVNIANANKEMVDVLKVPVAKYTDGNDTISTDYIIPQTRLTTHVRAHHAMMKDDDNQASDDSRHVAIVL